MLVCATSLFAEVCSGLIAASIEAKLISLSFGPSISGAKEKEGAGFLPVTVTSESIPPSNVLSIIEGPFAPCGFGAGLSGGKFFWLYCPSNCSGVFLT